MYEHVNIRRSQQSKAWVRDRSLAGIWVRILPGPWMSVSSECCVLSEISAPDWSLVHRIPTECGASVGDHEASIMRRLWPTRSCWTVERGCTYIYRHILTWNIRVLMRITTFVIYIKILTSFITHKRMQNTPDTALQYSEVHCHSFRPRCVTCAKPSPGRTLNKDYPLLREKFL